jgi:hypothetical protein
LQDYLAYRRLLCKQPGTDRLYGGRLAHEAVLIGYHIARDLSLRHFELLPIQERLYHLQLLLVNFLRHQKFWYRDLALKMRAAYGLVALFGFGEATRSLEGT